MKPFDIYIVYISWGGNGKRRPVLVLFEHEGEVSVFPITTQYQNKSAAVRSKYIAISDWQQSGLDKPSYIDINKAIDLPTTTIAPSPIGMLSERDKKVLLEALEA